VKGERKESGKEERECRVKEEKKITTRKMKIKN